MWSKITSVLKPNHSAAKEDSQSQVLNKVYEQHPNMSMFHSTNESGVQQAPEPPSPSVHSKRNMFKRLSRGALKDDFDGHRSASPFEQPPALPPKVRNSPDLSSTNGGL